MAYLFQAYSGIKTFAEHHKLLRVNGFYTNSVKQEDYADERTFTLEMNKNFFVATRFEENYFIVVCKKDLFKNTIAYNKLENLTRARKEMLVIYEHEPGLNKVATLLETYRPIVNVIPLQSFNIGPLNHITSPISVERFDYNELERILMIKKKDLPEISFSDPLAAWMRLRPDDVIKIVNYSPTAGKSVAYRVVV